MQNAALERNKLLWHILQHYDKVDAPSESFMKESRSSVESLDILSQINIDYVLKQIELGEVINLKQFYRLPPKPELPLPPVRAIPTKQLPTPPLPPSPPPKSSNLNTTVFYTLIRLNMCRFKIVSKTLMDHLILVLMNLD
jgi:hypothetical protein